MDGGMKMNIDFPQDEQFLIDLILQRTGPFLKIGGGLVLNDWFINGNRDGLISYIYKSDRIHQYVELLLEELKLEVDGILNRLPVESLTRIASIGPGNGLIELMLLSRGLTEELLLIDIEHTAQHYHGFSKKGSGYASLKSTQKFIHKNLDIPVKIKVCNPIIEDLPEFGFSLLISLLSMGFHYPCDDYVDFISMYANEKSFLVFDKRRDTLDGGYEKIEVGFQKIASIYSTKSDRIFFKKS